jgi:hypothetical protein
MTFSLNIITKTDFSRRPDADVYPASGLSVELLVGITVRVIGAVGVFVFWGQLIHKYRRRRSNSL